MLIEGVSIEHGLHMKLADVLARLNLKMGVFDLKYDGNGEPVWLEVNPQGQFLFIQALTGLDLIAGFTDFLVSQARAVPAQLRAHD